MSMCKRFIRFIVRIQIAEIVQRRQVVWTQELAHVFANLCMTVSDDCIVLRALGLEFCMILFHDS
jgi:hypothetical protein